MPRPVKCILLIALSGVNAIIFLHARGVIKDLACLDKIARQILSRTQRLRFYYYYIGANALQSKHKKQVKKIVNFFSGRDS